MNSLNWTITYSTHECGRAKNNEYLLKLSKLFKGSKIEHPFHNFQRPSHWTGTCFWHFKMWKIWCNRWTILKEKAKKSAILSSFPLQKHEQVSCIKKVTLKANFCISQHPFPQLPITFTSLISRSCLYLCWIYLLLT